MAGGAPQWVEAMHMMSYDQGERHSTWEFAERVAKQGAQLLPAAKVTHGLASPPADGTPLSLSLTPSLTR